MPATLETIAGRAAHSPDREAFGRAVMGALAGSGGVFSVDVASSLAVIEMATKLRLWLLVTRAAVGGVSATVSPEFLTATYPAMLALTRALDGAGLEGVWTPEGERTVRLGRARHLFVSADRLPGRSRGRSLKPDTLLEVVSAERVDPEWHRTRVRPRALADGLTTVVYGAPGGDTLFQAIRTKNLLAEWRDGKHRHFSLGRADGPALVGR